MAGSRRSLTSTPVQTEGRDHVQRLRQRAVVQDRVVDPTFRG